MRFTPQLLPSRSGNVGILELNNPKPLHALTLDMLYSMQDVLEQWFYPSGGDRLSAILVKGNNRDTKTPAFCAGGDVKYIYTSGVDEFAKKYVMGQGVPGLGTADFFRQEYIVNYMVAMNNHSNGIPQVSLWDGVVMGGGVGISIHGKYRVATERTVFSMPETNIGLFPDVGSMYWMPKMLPPSTNGRGSGLAAYLALTGYRLHAFDLVQTGLATHFVPSALLKSLEDALVKASLQRNNSGTGTDLVASVLDSFHKKPDPPSNSSETNETTPLQRNMDMIDQVFGKALDLNSNVTVEHIFKSLETLKEQEKSLFADETLQTLKKMSPTSLKVTLEGLRRGALLNDIHEDLKMEYRMSQACMRLQNDCDFFPGIRAALIEKNGKPPEWNDATLEAVTEEKVQSFFDPIKHEWEVPASILTKATAIASTSKI